MNLVIDIGNSRTKTAVFEGEKLIHEAIVTGIDKLSIQQFLSQFTKIDKCIISSVKEEAKSLISSLTKLGIKTWELTSDLPLPFPNHYKSPETLGKDRIAAVAGAVKLFPEKDVLVIDAGTAITFDLFVQDQGYIGGTISPGLEMRFKALHQFTARLPLVNSNKEINSIGQTTTEAIQSGIKNGLIFEIEGYLTKFSNKYPQIAVILTGGDAQFFDNKLKNAIFVVQNLTVVGLNFILDYNAKTL